MNEDDKKLLRELAEAMNTNERDALHQAIVSFAHKVCHTSGAQKQGD